MNKILILRNAPCSNHVRVQKFIRYFSENNIPFQCICWKRKKGEGTSDKSEVYIFKGGGYSNKWLAPLYLFWMIALLLYILFRTNAEKNIFLACDFDSALPVAIAKLVKPSIRFVYDIHDDFALRYKFPKFIRLMIEKLDYFVKKRASSVIHVDKKRVRKGEQNYSIIPNIPPKITVNSKPKKKFTQRKNKIFGYAGLLSSGRGLKSLYKFFDLNKHCKLILAGNIVCEEAYTLIKLKNVEYIGVLEQRELLEKLSECDAIFSLYNPSLEINKLASSNKLYDGLMLGKPVITNKELDVSKMVEERNIGITIPYEYNQKWQIVEALSQSAIKVMSNNSKKIFDEEFNYEIVVEKVIKKIFEPLIL